MAGCAGATGEAARRRLIWPATDHTDRCRGFWPAPAPPCPLVGGRASASHPIGAERADGFAPSLPLETVARDAAPGERTGLGSWAPFLTSVWPDWPAGIFASTLEWPCRIWGAGSTGFAGSTRTREFFGPLCRSRKGVQPGMATLRRQALQRRALRLIES